MAIIYSLHLPFETPLLSHVFIVLEVPKNWKVAGLIPYDHQELDIPEDMKTYDKLVLTYSLVSRAAYMLKMLAQED